jgi:hypothetical protein
MAIWCPPRSPLRIEYDRDLLQVLPPKEHEPDSAGILYGTRFKGFVRVVSQKRKSGLEPVGVFSARARGEVFLPEADLVRLEALDSPSAIALVIAGDAAGFFVREPGGSMQTIKSYQEFPIRRHQRRKALAKRPWIPLAFAAGVVSVAVMTILAWPASAFTIQLSDQPSDGQMHIRLHRNATPGARLLIVDGGERRSVSITPDLTSIVYSPRTSDVHVRLIR